MIFAYGYKASIKKVKKQWQTQGISLCFNSHVQLNVFLCV